MPWSRWSALARPHSPYAGVVGGAVVLRGVAAERVGRQLPGQPAEAVVVRGVDQADARPAERGAEQVAVPGPPAEQERRRPVGVLRRWSSGWPCSARSSSTAGSSRWLAEIVASSVLFTAASRLAYCAGGPLSPRPCCRPSWPATRSVARPSQRGRSCRWSSSRWRRCRWSCSMIPPGPVRSAAIRCAVVLDARLGLAPAGPWVAKLAFTKLSVTGLLAGTGPTPTGRSTPRRRTGSGCRSRSRASVEQRVRAAGVALGEQVGQDADDVVARTPVS